MSQTHRNLRYCTLDGVFATPWFVISLPGSFLTAALLNAYFDVGPFWFGLISAMPALANAVHIFIVPAIARFIHVRDLTVSQGWLNLGIWIGALIGIAYIPKDSPHEAGLFFCIAFGAISLSSSLVVVGWTAWMTEIVPSRVRGRYIGQRNRLCNFSTLAYMVGSLLVLKCFPDSRAAYIALIGIALLGRFLGMLMLHLIYTKDPTGGTLTHTNWLNEIISLRSHRTLVRFIIFGSVAGFWMALMGAAGPLYALQELGATPSDYTAYSIAATISGALFVKIWGQLIDRHGAIPIIIITLVAWRLGDIIWLMVTPETLYLMYPTWIWGGCMATGYLLAIFTLLLKLIPKEKRTAGVSLNLTATSIAGAIAPAIGGWVIANSSNWNVDIVTTYRAIILTGIIGSIASIVIFYKLKEPETDPTLNTIHGAMRTLRNLTVTQGVAFISSTVLFRRKRSH